MAAARAAASRRRRAADRRRAAGSIIVRRIRHAIDGYRTAGSESSIVGGHNRRRGSALRCGDAAVVFTADGDDVIC